MHFSRVRLFLQRSSYGTLLAGLFFLLLGIRLYTSVRYFAEIPIADDGTTVTWLQKWSEGVHDWPFIWHYLSGGHPMHFFYLSELGNYYLNGGFWDARFSFLVAGLVHSLFGLATLWTFGDVLGRRDRWWIYLFTVILFAIPFEGSQISWGLLWVNSMPVFLSLPAIYLAARYGQRWGGVAAICLLCAVAAVQAGAGCSVSLLICGLTLFNAGMNRRITSRDVVLAAICLMIFLVEHAFTAPSTTKVGFLEGVNALFRTLAWPTVFVPGIGLFTLIPLAALVVVQWFAPRFRSVETTFVTGVAGLHVLLAVATGALRGDNGNGGMPASRYADFFILLPLVTAVTFCLLYRGSSGRRRIAWAALALVWIGCQSVGFAVQTIYRVIPLLSQETGEWNDAQRQTTVREVTRGHIALPNYDFSTDQTVGLPPEVHAALAAHKPPLAMTTAMLTGFDLEAGSQGNYTLGGYHPSYQGRPGRVYRGSYDPANPQAADRKFLSGPFQPQATYITLDVLVDKKSRFTNYRLDGLRLTLLDETSGNHTELLPRLARTFPFVLRDWEVIYAPVTPGHTYRIESQDTSLGGWLAFSEPLEAGRMTPLLLSASQSGKLLCLVAFCLLVLCAYLYWLEGSLATPDAPAPQYQQHPLQTTAYGNTVPSSMGA